MHTPSLLWLLLPHRAARKARPRQRLGQLGRRRRDRRPRRRQLALLGGQDALHRVDGSVGRRGPSPRRVQRLVLPHHGDEARGGEGAGERLQAVARLDQRRDPVAQQLPLVLLVALGLLPLVLLVLLLP